MLEKTGEVVLGKTKCCACEKTATKLANGHPACAECADSVSKYMTEKKAEDNPAKVMFPE